MIRFAARTFASASNAELDEDIGLTPEARQWLLARAGGDAARLRMLMRTALFLAETENAPEIDIDLARRAGALQPASTPDDTRGPAWGVGRWPGYRAALAAWTILFIVLGMAMGMALEKAIQSAASQQPAPHAAASSPAPLPPQQASGAPQGAPALVANPSSSLPQAPSGTAAVPQPQANPLPPAPHLAAAPPSAPQPIPLPKPLARPPAPAAVPLVVVRFYLASPGSAPRARFIEQRLAAAGFLVRTVPDPRMPPLRGAAVVYFYASDAALAQRAEAASALLDTRPLLARTRASHRPPHGTIELLLP